jgi:hypothetical protein
VHHTAWAVARDDDDKDQPTTAKDAILPSHPEHATPGGGGGGDNNDDDASSSADDDAIGGCLSVLNEKTTPLCLP